MNAGIYRINIHILNEHGKIRTRKNSVIGHSSLSVETSEFNLKVMNIRIIQFTTIILQSCIMTTSFQKGKFWKITVFPLISAAPQISTAL